MKDFVKTVVVLSLIAIISGALLGLVHKITYVPEEEILNEKLKIIYADADSFKSVENAAEKYAVDSLATLKAIYIPQKGGNPVSGNYVYNVSVKGYGGNIELLVLVTDNKVASIVTVSASETAGMGDRALKEGFLEKFKKLDLSEGDYVIKKSDGAEDGDIQAISGATVTSTAMVNVMNLVAGVHRLITAEDAAL